MKICACCTSSCIREATVFSISCFSRAALYSAFSRRSPLLIASPISREFSGISTSMRCFRSLLLRLEARPGHEQPEADLFRLRLAEEAEVGELLLDAVLEVDA